MLCYCTPFFFNYRENNIFTRNQTKVNLQLELYDGKRLLVSPVAHKSITETQKGKGGQKILHRHVLMLVHWLAVPSSN